MTALNEVDLDALRADLAVRGGAPTASGVASSLRQLGHVVSDTTIRTTLDALRRETVGAGPLDDLLRQPGVTDVLVNGHGAVYIDRGWGLERTGVAFVNDDQVRRLAVRIAASAGRRLDDGSPFVDARLADGTRVHAILGCLADVGTVLSLRVPSAASWSLDDWVAAGSLTSSGAGLLRRLVRAKAALLISGGTGTGKTTLLGALLGAADPRERIVVVEDSRELNPTHPHCVRLQARQPNAEGAGTVHANSATDVLPRLEALAALGGLGREALHAQAVAALDVVIHVRRGRDGRRRVEQIGVLGRASDGAIAIRPAVSFSPTGVETPGPGWSALEQVMAR